MILAVAFILAIFLALLFGLWFIPSWRKAKRIERMEEEFSLFLRLCAIHSSFQSFEKALRTASTGFSELGPEFRRVLQDIDAGKSVPAALQALGSRMHSLMIQRACMQLCFSYAEGDAQALASLSQEFSQHHHQRLKRFGNKTAFLSAWFVVLSCLVPALFSSYVIIGSSFLSFSLSAEQIIAAFAVFFPFLSAALVAYVVVYTPGMRL